MTQYENEENLDRNVHVKALFNEVCFCRLLVLLLLVNRFSAGN